MKACRVCGKPATGGNSSNFCSDEHRRQAQKETNEARYAERRAERAANRRQATCPSCNVRHWVPRMLPGEDAPITLRFSRNQMDVLYRRAREFIEQAPEEVHLDEPCVMCGRWSIVAFLDWLKPDVAA